LAHPLENLILADTGYTWNDLFWQGRYISVSNVVCRHCGHLFQHRRLDAGQPGCSAALALGLASGAAAGFAARNLLIGLIVCYFVGLSMALAVGFIAQRYLRWKFQARAAELAAESNCPACGLNDSASIVGATSAFCPACRQRTLSFKSAGIS
jgi:hypothetical protein